MQVSSPSRTPTSRARFCDPPHAGFDFWVEAYQRALVAHGGDPLSGRKLFGRFLEAGIPAPELIVAQRVYVSGEGKTLPYLTVEATADAIVSEGIASEEQVRAALASLAEFAADPRTVCGSPRNFQAWSRRP